MLSQQTVFLVIVFAVVFGLALLAMFLFSTGPIRQRLAGLAAPQAGVAAGHGNGWIERIEKVAKPFATLSTPENGWEKSPLRTRFINAGWRNSSAPAVYFAAKTVLAISLPILVLLLVTVYFGSVPRNKLLLLLLLCAAIGYHLPNAMLSRTIGKRQLEIFESFPDALDLLTICVEAGLSLDSALAKVAAEMHLKSLVLSQELQLVLLELRAGFSKEKALRNLALRTGVEDIDTLVAMLIQSERFGTSMGASLRVHAENLRTKRRFRAEESAAKIALKLLFPLIFGIFPTLMLVLMGPAFIQIYRVMLPVMGAQH
jgi:tight adherence protein C